MQLPSAHAPQVPPKSETLKGVKQILAVASGKGGVGKSTVSVNLALALAKSGAQVGLMDADVYGPSIPMMLGLVQRPHVTDGKVVPIETHGMKVISMGLLTTDDMPVIWRGPMVAGIIQQFLEQVEWGGLDYLIIDMPPGTGDVQLTLAQKASLAGAIIVTTPQDVALLDARRGLKMFQQVNVPVLGIVENMSYFVCDQCEARHDIFREGGGRKVAREMNIPLLQQIPLDHLIAVGGDTGEPVVAYKEETPSAKAYVELGQKVMESLQERAKGDSKPLSLQW